MYSNDYVIVNYTLWCVNVIYSMYVTTPNVHISVGKETKSKFTTSGAKNSGVPNETLSLSRGLYLKRDEEKSHLNHKNKPCYIIWTLRGLTHSEIHSGHWKGM